MGEKEEKYLEMKGISKAFGGVHALLDADFSCEKGVVHALIGENGAGKSTLVKILCGVVRKDAGSVFVDGKELSIETPIDAERYGIAAVFQELSFIPELSVAENIFLGREPGRTRGLISFKKMNAAAGELLEKLGISIDPRIIVNDLSLAEKQFVEIAKALSKNPDIIIFDEATSALGQSEVDFLFELIGKLTKEEHKTAIFISHKMNELEAIADYATVFRDARYVSTFKMGTVSNEQITKWIAGRDLDKTYPRRKSSLSGDIVISLKNVSASGKLKNITVDVRKGEILGIAGLHGHGQSEFLRVLFGAIPIDGGDIFLNGKNVIIKNPRDAINKGVSFMPEDRKTEGLHVTLSVNENLSLMTLDQKSRLGWMVSSIEKDENDNMVSRLNIKISSLEQLVVNLSGGNQQKVVIGKVLSTKSDVLLMGDPTRGIDVGTKAELYQVMRALSEKGQTIILYSTEINELIGLCDRVLVLKNGQTAALLEGDEITKASIVNASLGIGRDDINAKVE